MEHSRTHAPHTTVGTSCGRELSVGRLRLDGVADSEHRPGFVTLSSALRPFDQDQWWASLTPVQARDLASALLAQATALEADEPPEPSTIEVEFVEGEAYSVKVRGHVLMVDQPADMHGEDLAPTPTELFVVSLVSCIAFYAGRYLSRHGLSRDGLHLTADFAMAEDRPARVSAVNVHVTAPAEFPDSRRRALLAMMSHCTVHNSLGHPPAVDIVLK